MHRISCVGVCFLVQGSMCLGRACVGMGVPYETLLAVMEPSEKVQGLSQTGTRALGCIFPARFCVSPDLLWSSFALLLTEVYWVFLAIFLELTSNLISFWLNK